MNEADTRVKLSLIDLKRKKVIGFSYGFTGSNLNDLETAWNRIFLQSTQSTRDDKALKLVCKTANGSVVSNYIRSENNILLIQIKHFLDNMVGKSISDIYNIKFLPLEIL